ncbi:MAG: mannitol dehydrogenase family protein [Defluviitaleaceae bacterium]|nr:mannitol dehydrogenase family protein [Defluviitaleaceae bacterium]
MNAAAQPHSTQQPTNATAQSHAALPITWLHFGAGNIFRAFLAAVQQDLIEANLVTGALAVCECFDEEIIPTVFTPYNNETLAVTLHVDGRIEQRKLTSIAEAITFANANAATHTLNDIPTTSNTPPSNNAPAAITRLHAIVADPVLQIISLTITEKGYAVDPTRVCTTPAIATTTPECITSALLARYNNGAAPLALVSMDNFAANGNVLKTTITTIAQIWESNGTAPACFTAYAASLAYPWSMIDKITPHPSTSVADSLARDGFPHTQITKTAKNTVIAPFVNAEAAQYLVMENDFPNGRPPFGALINSGVYLTDRETVRKIDHMKVCACLNPLHTILAISGMLLNYPTISACMQDKALVRFIRRAAAEALPVVAHPGIIDPQAFLDEVLTQRFPNPFIPDAPARIATDSSQKIPVRFGQTLQARQKAGLPASELQAIPLLIAIWLRYRMGTDDAGNPLTLSPDPLIPTEIAALEGLPLVSTSTTTATNNIDLKPILSNAKQFGIDLYTTPLATQIEETFLQLASAPGAVQNTIKNFL